MTKLTERCEKYAPLEEYPNTLWRKQGFKSGWLAAIEEVGKGLEATNRPKNGLGSKLFYEGQDALRAEMAKVLGDLKK